MLTLLGLPHATFPPLKPPGRCRRRLCVQLCCGWRRSFRLLLRLGTRRGEPLAPARARIRKAGAFARFFSPAMLLRDLLLSCGEW